MDERRGEVRSVSWRGEVMCTVNHQERKELIEALHNNRKFADLPKITQASRRERTTSYNKGCRACNYHGETKGALQTLEVLLDSRPHTKENSNGNIDKLDQDK
ncbi:hypothetical protein FXO38_04528 [Capsicum annuum]|uniref:Uncharacterized protein n=1 Tax=Capsicum annuum TaxID=4072 RepID=A0A2G2XUK2_CAPAN|nr:hypothetical protein FXO37_29505 [Capsicum annuum]KAF3676000.1 hypothetical protein FXO38_04528 [Capsicum annuum]PHT60991.1 hypothetical protein T459_35159 [Capsicum annuum]